MSKGVEARIRRILDANLNRLREALRVLEDIVRYALDDPQLSARLKQIRHEARLLIACELLDSRDVTDDFSKGSLPQERKRPDINSLLTANFKRAQEASRVLEEVLKLLDASESERFKLTRYTLYALEQEILAL